MKTGQFGRVNLSSPDAVTNGRLKRLFPSCTVDVGIWVNKDVENQTKYLCPFKRTEVNTKTKIKLRPPEEVPNRRPEILAR